jgi:hypothetical protein
MPENRPFGSEGGPESKPVSLARIIHERRGASGRGACRGTATATATEDGHGRAYGPWPWPLPWPLAVSDLGAVAGWRGHEHTLACGYG